MKMLTPYWTSRSLTSGLFDEMNRFVSEFDRENLSSAYDERSFAPACEIAEEDGHFLVSLDIPGMKKDDFKIEVKENVLSVAGERKRELKSEGKSKIQRYEKSYGYFKRSFSLPTSVNADKVEARYEDGVLELYLPKTQSAQPRKIEIQSGKGGFFEKFLGVKKETPEMTATASADKAS